jgi:hypothetical protein
MVSSASLSLSGVRPDQWKNAARNRAKNPDCGGLLIAARTQRAAVAALIVAPWWQKQTMSCSCRSVSSKKRFASP